MKMKKHAGNRQTLMSRKFFSMLVSGTIASMIVNILLMSDQVIAGFTVGSDGVAGIMLVTPIYSFAAFPGAVISIGAPILYITEMGKFNKEKADQVFGLGVTMSIIVGIIMFIMVSLFGEAYLLSTSPREEILTQALAYLFWIRFTILIMPIQMLIAASVYYDGDEVIPNIASAVQGIGNIVFSIVLSRFMGNAGIGLASFLFYFASLCVYMCHFLKESNSLRLHLSFAFGLLKDVVRFSIIDASSYLFLAIYTAGLNHYVMGHFGSEYLVLVSAITLSREFQILFEGLGGASSPIFSVYVGEHNREGVRHIYSLAQKTAIIEGIIVTIVMILIAPFVPSVLDVSDPGIVRWVVEGVRMTALGSAFIGFLYLLTYYYLIIKKIALGLAVCAVRDVVFSVSLVFVLGGIWGIFGMFMGLVAAPALAYAALMIYISLRYGREDCPLLLSGISEEDNCRIFNLITEEEEIVNLRGEVEALLKEKNVNKKTITRAMLMIEEMYLFIRKMNDGKAVNAECSVFLYPDGVRIISKDDGVSFDMADEDLSTVSLSSYVVASYLEQKEYGNRHLTTMSFNRNSFFIKYGQS